MPTTASASGSEIASLISQIELTTSNIPQDEELRQKLYDATRKLNLALESPGDTIQRLVHLGSPAMVTIFWYNLRSANILQSSQPTCARLAYQLGIFNLLVRHGDQGMTVHELLEQTEADDMLLRTCISFSVRFREAHFPHRSSHAVPCVNGNGDRDCGRYLRLFEYNKDSRSSSCPEQSKLFVRYRSGLPMKELITRGFRFEIAMPCYQQLVAFLATTGYRNPSDTANSAFQLAFDTKKLPFDWLMEHSDFLKNFSLWMTVQHEGNKVWLDELPFEKEFCQNVEPETPLFVDIGGNIGHQCLLLKTTYPEITGRVILQDLAPALQHALPIEGVEKMAHDFWTKQPIKGQQRF